MVPCKTQSGALGSGPEMTRISGGMIALGAALLLVAAPNIEAQQEAEEQQARPALQRMGVERIMSMRERLELTDEQITELDALRREIVSERSAAAAEMAEMRSQLSAGQIRQSEMMAFIEDRRDQAEGSADDRRARIEGVLNAAQLEAVQEMGQRARSTLRARAFRENRGAGVRGSRGPRGERGWGRAQIGRDRGFRGARDGRRFRGRGG